MNDRHPSAEAPSAVPPAENSEGQPSKSIWLGLLWPTGVAAAWATLATMNPTTTYHLAPLVVVLAWPAALALSGTDSARWQTLALTSGLTAAGVTTAALAATGNLEGPFLRGGSVLGEIGLTTAAAAVIGAALVARAARVRR